MSALQSVSARRFARCGACAVSPPAQRRDAAVMALVLMLGVCFGACGGAGGARALDAAVEAMEEGGQARVVEVVDGDTVRLDSGLEVRLVGIQAPKLALGRRGFIDWPLAAEAKAALAALALGRTVELRYGGRRLDRHGRALAHLIIAPDLWIQGALIEQGFARVYSFADNRAGVPALLKRERLARAARRGLWADPFYALRTPETVGAYIEGFELVEGRVLRVGRAAGRTYLNFGTDIATDFTAVVAARDARLFEAAGLDLKAYEGRMVRIRGWVEEVNGPMIEVTHPEQIELVQ
jgi:endonuclease YncB( thermonuclease family)